MFFPKIKNIIRLLRPRHWIKNILVLAPLVFSGNLFVTTDAVTAFAGWIAFNLTASAVYVFNDIRDKETDRLHEIKKYRPIAAGAVSVPTAWGVFAVLIILSQALNFYIAPSGAAAALLILYLMLNICYSCGLKRIPLIDIAILVSGFLIRIFYGAFLIHTAVSVWLYLTVTTMSLYLGLGKRRNELNKQIGSNDEIQGVLKFYTPEFLDKNMYMCLTLTIAFYALWAISPVPVILFHTDTLVWTVPLVILICMRYSLLIESKTYADPVDVLTSDKVLLLLVAFYCICMAALLYGRVIF